MTGAGPSATGQPSQRPYAARRWARPASGLRHWRGIKLQKWPDLVGVLTHQLVRRGHLALTA
jgi:hypothetical protein